MNIVYQGSFLREGLSLLGHTVIDVSFKDDEDINSKLDGIGCAIDLVLLELWDHREIPGNIYRCKYRLAAYCIDSSINEFWLSPLCNVFDYVFFDQVSTVKKFRELKINSSWLPLCVQSSDIMDSVCEKKYDIVFVGNTSHSRIKRNKLLVLLKRHFDVTVFQDIPKSTMIELFSQAKIVLNENLFDGMTLRVLQGLASGSLVVTEEGGDGVDTYLADSEHIVCYNHDNVIEKIDAILANYDSYRTIAVNGFNACRQSHTSQARAYELIENIETGAALNQKPCCEETRKYYETKARYALRMRFGGSMRGVISGFEAIAGAGGSMASKAFLELGNIAARRGETEKAELLYIRSLHNEDTPYAHLKIALIYAHKGDIQRAKNALAKAALNIPMEHIARNKKSIELLEKSTEPFELLFIIATFYYISGQVFSVGFLKQCEDRYPDTALEVALMAWKLKPLPEIMSFIITCSEAVRVENDLLPMLVGAIKNCRLSDAHILYTAELAKRCYDFDLAVAIASSFRKTIRM